MKNYYGLLIVLCLSYTASGQVKFVIESLPETTPADDSIYLTGTFNDWNTTDPKCLLQKQPNGQLSVEMTFDEPVVEYKFTRGNWLKVETGSQNQYIPNRILINHHQTETIPIIIQNWQDLGGARSFEYLSFYYFAIAFLSLSIFIFSFRIFKKDFKRKQMFSIIHGSYFLVYLGAVAYYVVNPIWQTYLLILSQSLIFAWGANIQLVISVIEKRDVGHFSWSCYAPVTFATIIAVLRLINVDFLAFLAIPAFGHIPWGQLLMIGVGAMMALYFLAQIIGGLKWNEANRPHFISQIILASHIICLCFVFVSLGAGALGFQDYRLLEFKWFLVLFSIPVWVLVIGLWHDSQLFKEKSHVYVIENANELLSNLRELMESQKAYQDAELNMNRLAELLGTKTHILSKLLNEHYEQNFRDFVNSYRVKEFINQAQTGKLQKLTFLGLAHEVGFNSKSTFNLAFKKITNKSPREYFK